MPLTTKFLTYYPEFAETDVGLVNKKLDEAKSRISKEAWGTIYNEGVFALTAHLLAISPEGENLRLRKDNNETIYWAEFRRMNKTIQFGAGRVS